MYDMVWSPPRITGTGKAVMSALPTSKFWFAWRNKKHELKKKGIQVKKNDDGSWVVNKWMAVEDYYKLTTNELIPDEIKTIEGLLEYQISHTAQLISAIQMNGWALDGSDTGTGKSFCALAVVRELKRKPFIICPKAVISTWWRVAEYMGVELIDVINYERLKTWRTPYVDKGDEYATWNLDLDTFMIFDEAHKCKNFKSINAKLLISAKAQGFSGMALSATIADNPLQMKAIGYALRLFPNLSDFWRWARMYGVVPGDFGGMEFMGDPEDLLKLHQAIYQSSRGSRMSIKDLGDKFPQNQVIAETYTMDSAKEIQKIYKEMEKELQRLTDAESQDLDEDHPLTIMLRARQKVELLKIPTIVDMVLDLLEERLSVAIFVNFEDSVQALMEKLNTSCVIHGKQNTKKGTLQRQKNIDDFQADRSNIIICNIKAGGVGISLHDLHGNRPRVSLICPTYSAQDLVQALGRIHRAGAKSPARQRIIFAADTIEETICSAVQNKVNNIHALNDGDLAGVNLGI